VPFAFDLVSWYTLVLAVLGDVLFWLAVGREGKRSTRGGRGGGRPPRPPKRTVSDTIGATVSYSPIDDSPTIEVAILGKRQARNEVRGRVAVAFTTPAPGPLVASCRIRDDVPDVLAKTVKRLAHRVGVEVSHYRPASARRYRSIRDAGVKTVLDVGAGTGQYAAGLRAAGYKRRIVSFEPLMTAFAELEARVAEDEGWELHRVALGDNDEVAVLNVASNLASSSLLQMRAEHHAGAPDVTMTGTETTPVARLDTFDLKIEPPAMLKLDVQGYEDRVLVGAENTLRHVALIECELSLDQLYEGQPTFRQMIDLLGDRGFQIIDLDPFFYDKTDGRVLSVDAMFRRERAEGV
jgi:FkbM family methyltransferase